MQTLGAVPVWGLRHPARPPVAPVRATGKSKGCSVLKKVLIANRGEIAVRVIRTCRELGVATVAVYSELDREALHVRMADEAYALGGQTAAESYLNTEAILDAIEPQRGRRASTPATASSPRTPTSPGPSPPEGVTFIGPPPEADRDHGRQDQLALAAEPAGVSGVPGRSEPLASADEVVDFGESTAGRWPSRPPTAAVAGA